MARRAPSEERTLSARENSSLVSGEIARSAMTDAENAAVLAEQDPPGQPAVDDISRYARRAELGARQHPMLATRDPRDLRFDCPDFAAHIAANPGHLIAAPTAGSGGGGIRTHEPGLPVTGFQDRRIQPLCHPSGCPWPRLARASKSSGYAGRHGGRRPRGGGTGRASSAAGRWRSPGRAPVRGWSARFSRREPRSAGFEVGRLRPLVQRRRADRRDDARLELLDRVLDVDPAAGLVKVEAGIVLGDLNRRLDRARARAREPRRHRPPDARRLGLDRDARDRRPLRQPLLPGRVDGADRRRRDASRAQRERPTPMASARPGSDSARSASSTR